MHRIVLMLLLCAIAGYGQTDVWKASRTGTLSAQAIAFTVALPATGPSQQVDILDYTLQCTADCTVSTERNGSAPSTTAGTWRPENLDTAPQTQPIVGFFYASDSVGGTVHDEPFVFPANAIVPWGNGAVQLNGIGATKSFTVRIASFTGTYRFQIRVRIRR